METTTKMDWRGEEFQRMLHEKLGEALELSAEQLEQAAYAECPMDTGKLCESIRHETDKNDLVALIGSDVEYGVYVELGTRKMQAANNGRGFLRLAMNEDVDIGKNFENLF